MKKIIIVFSFLVINNCVYSQTTYPNAKQYLKEFLTIQSLLAENRTEELTTFFADNRYFSEGDFFFKIDENLDGLENYIYPGINVRNGGKNEYADNFLDIIFFKRTKNGSSLNLTLDEVNYIKNTIQNLYETGITYPVAKAYENYKKTAALNVEKINRYKFKIYSDQTPNKISYVKVSNFFDLSTIDKNKTNNVVFFGPGKTKYTEISYFEPINSSDEVGKFIYKMQLASVINNNSQPSDKFNIDFFMSLNDFNDRIWLDK